MHAPARTLLAASLAFLAAITGRAGALTLARDGEPTAVIVHNGHTGGEGLHAPKEVRRGDMKPPPAELQAYLEQITGAELPLVASLEEAGDRAAVVLETADAVPGASDRPTARQAYRIRTRGDRLTLTAASPLGLQYAVYGLLEDHLGCRFYTFRAKGLGYLGPGYELVPKRPTLSLEGIDDLQEPAFIQRGFIFWPPSTVWVRKNRGGGYPADTVAAGHNFYHLLPPRDVKKRGEVVKQGLFEKHPEWYPMNAVGERQPGWSMGLCGTNPELPQALAQALREHVERRKKRGRYDPAVPLSAAQGDGFTGCQCQACRKLVREQQSEAAPLILMLNRALDILSETHPDQQIITFAYFETLDAPKTLKPHENLWINVVSSARSQNMAGDQVGPIAANPANRDYARALRQWPRIAPGRVTTWHWTPYRAEWPAVFYLGDIVRYWHDCGIAGTNPQLCGSVWRELIAWVYLKLAWNPQADEQKLVRQFLDDYYGRKAAPRIWDYLKLTQQAYEDSLHCPSAVRWSGWTRTTRLKIFDPRLPQMTELMDKALAAAQQEKAPVYAQHVRQAMGASIDVVNMDAAKAEGFFGPVAHPADGKPWLVPGARPNMPACLSRATDAIVASGGGEHGALRRISWFLASNGGPIVRLRGDEYTADVCPDFRGQVTRLVHKPRRKDVLADAGTEFGYRDLFPGIKSQIWLPPEVAETDLEHPRLRERNWSGVWAEFENPVADRLTTDLTLSPPRYGFRRHNHLRRTVSVAGDALAVERRYVQAKGGGLKDPTRFTTRWMLAVPDPARAVVVVRGGGIHRALDLRYAVPGGIRGVKAGESLPGLDAMDERIDQVVAVSDAQVVKLEVERAAGGELRVRLNRGDGLAAVLTTPADGWDAVELQPVVDEKYLRVTLVGVPVPMSNDATTLDLPPQSLAVETVAKRRPPAARPDTEAAEEPVAAKLKKLDNGRAVNLIDGTELVWVPPGEFLRGSTKSKGGSDERPQRKIHLDGYWIAKTPVTVGQYKRYCEATGKTFEPVWGQSMRAGPKGKEDDYPVLVNWYEAGDYARWAGAALPTEAQWEKAARGTDGRAYPWGDEWEPAKCASLEATLYSFNAGSMPVGSCPDGASPYGLLDMAGNVWEWVADWYGHRYYRRAPAENPAGPEKGTHKVLRGGDSLWDERFSRCAARMVMPPHVDNWVKTGFRYVVPAQKTGGD
ncbi:MAG: DUF4838 domain-containing protein [bacterium]